MKTCATARKNYNKIKLQEFKANNNPLDWDVYFLKAWSLMEIEYLDAKQLPFYEALGEFMKNVSIDEQKYYLAFNLLNAAAPYLSDDFVATEFDFYGKVMSGKLEQKPRWKRSLSTVNGCLGELSAKCMWLNAFRLLQRKRCLSW